MKIKDMAPIEKLEYIINLFEENKSLAEITDLCGYSRKTNVKDFLKRNKDKLKEKGYFFDTEKDKLIKIDSECMALDSQVTFNDISLNLANENAKEQLFDLLTNYNNIKQMLEWFNLNKDQVIEKEQVEVVEVIQQGIQIDLPKYEGKAYRASIRINPVIWEEFDIFANKHSEFEKASLIAQAMKEYMEKHNK